ncbi:uncharacterized protein B0H18DRAFT_1104428 [Fomitopsis serialis]|uniref:uncharacterized protein n=1 Tax=Fomitopsis serialis TaxID=139415 RepID=UPI0020081E71|nr:uncharacterized protein B0H18DRAFT_1104428 [Neoantrodia serialis]KAH9926463.1 hypothetical protein B0H18DRAFT_1104428 [Neoantrodia serialis]
MPTNLLALNDDVLAILVSFLSCADAHQLSYTTRAIHDVATHRALHSVTLRSFPRVVKFCTYMLDNMRHRRTAIHELRIHCYIVPAPEAINTSRTAETYAEGGGLLTRLLQGATCLRIFALDCAEYWMEYQTRLVDVLSSMTHLTELELQVVGPNASRLINGMQSTPRKLVFKAPRRRGPANRQALPVGAKLELGSQLRITSVVHLAAMDPANQSELADLARIFPGTRSLDIRLEYSPPVRRGQPIPTIQWAALEYIRGPGFSLAKWRNVTGVHLLELVVEHSRQFNDYSIGLAAIAAVTNFQPVALVVRMDSTLNHDFWKQLIRSSERLRYLAVTADKPRCAKRSHESGIACTFSTYVRMTRAEQNYIAKWWGKFSQITKSWQIAELSRIVCLEIRCPLRRESQWEYKAGATGAFDLDVPSFEDPIYRAFPVSVRDTAPTLSYLSLDLSPEGESPWRYNFLEPEHSLEGILPLDLRWWRFEGTSNSRSVKVLDAAKGERIAAHLRSTRCDSSRPFSGSCVPHTYGFCVH